MHILQNFPQDRVIATCRDPEASSELSALTANHSKHKLIVVPLDITSASSHEELQQYFTLEGINSIDVLIANAGVVTKGHPEDEFFSCTPDDLDFVWRTNVLGSMLTLQSYSDQLLNSPTKLCVVISSNLGSITRAVGTGSFSGYRSSKAALNMLAVTYSEDERVRQAGGKVVCIHPGWVQTDMGSAGGRQPPVSVQDSAAGIVNIITKACEVQEHASISKHLIERERDPFKRKFMTDHCVFVGYDGDMIPW